MTEEEKWYPRIIKVINNTVPGYRILGPCSMCGNDDKFPEYRIDFSPMIPAGVSCWGETNGVSCVLLCKKCFGAFKESVMNPYTPEDENDSNR